MMWAPFAFLEAESKLCGQHYVQIRKSDNTEMPDIGTSFKLGVVEERLFIPKCSTDVAGDDIYPYQLT